MEKLFDLIEMNIKKKLLCICGRRLLVILTTLPCLPKKNLQKNQQEASKQDVQKGREKKKELKPISQSQKHVILCLFISVSVIIKDDYVSRTYFIFFLLLLLPSLVVDVYSNNNTRLPSRLAIVSLFFRECVLLIGYFFCKRHWMCMGTIVLDLKNQQLSLLIYNRLFLRETRARMP